MERFLGILVQKHRLRAGLTASGLATFVIWPLSYLSGMLHGHYNPLTQTLSRLETGPGDLVEKTAFIFVGTMALAFSLGLLSCWARRRKWYFLTGIVLVFCGGLATVTIGIIPPTTSKQFFNVNVHFLLAGVIMGAFPCCSFLMAPWFWRHGWKSMAVYTLGAGMVGIGLGVGFSAADSYDIAGLLERMIIFNETLWMAVTALHLIRMMRRKPDTV